MRNVITALVLSAAFASFCAPRAAAHRILIRPGGGGDYPTIQAGLNAATSGDTVELADGVFSGAGNRQLSFGGRSILLRSQSGSAVACTIRCDGYRGFEFMHAEGPGARLEGITVTGGASDALGGAVYCNGASPTISRCVFTLNSSGDQGGAFYANSGSAALIECVFRDNTAPFGGAVCVVNSPPNGSFLTGCTFARNTSDHGGAIYL